MMRYYWSGFVLFMTVGLQIQAGDRYLFTNGFWQAVGFQCLVMFLYGLALYMASQKQRAA